MKKHGPQAGFTLIEMVIALVLTVVVTGAVSVFVITVSRAEAEQSDMVSAMNELSDARYLVKQWIASYDTPGTSFGVDESGAPYVLTGNGSGEIKRSILYENGSICAQMKSGDRKLACHAITNIKANYDSTGSLMKITLICSDGQTLTILLAVRTAA